MSAPVRLADICDIPALAALEQNFPTDRLNRRQWRYLLTKGNSEVLVVAEAGAILGNAVLLYRKNSPGARLYSLVVHPDQQQKGIGRALLQAAETQALKRGCSHLVLEVRADNPRAISIYQKAGYEKVCELEDYYEDHAPGWRMRKALVASH